MKRHKFQWNFKKILAPALNSLLYQPTHSLLCLLLFASYSKPTNFHRCFSYDHDDRESECQQETHEEKEKNEWSKRLKINHGKYFIIMEWKWKPSRVKSSINFLDENRFALRCFKFRVERLRIYCLMHARWLKWQFSLFLKRFSYVIFPSLFSRARMWEKF